MGNTRTGDLIRIFSQLFSGNNSFHGIHKYRAAKPGQKEEGISWTEKDKVNIELYKKHLHGLQGLGICPLKENSTCAFGAIDVDVYDNEQLLHSIIDAIYKWNLPLLPFSTKSGGLHLYLFLEPDKDRQQLPTGSETIRVLSFLSELLFEKRQEIFPKQSISRPDKQGNWINLPYYNADTSRQYLIGRDYKRISFHRAIELIQLKRASLESIQTQLESLPFGDGPPCLQKLLLNGGPGEGGRNVFLFNSAIYAKEKDHASYDVLIDEINDSITTPLDEQELTTIKKSVIKKEYTYECNKNPLCDVCDKDLCSTRKYGVGQNNGLFMGVNLGTLTIHKGRGISYSLDVARNNKTVTIHFDSPRDFRNQEVFIDSVLAHLHYKVSKIKAEKWDKIMNSILEGAEEDEPELEDENTLHSRITKMVINFITKHLSDNLIDLQRGLAYRDSKKQRVLFKSDDLWSYLVDNEKQRGLKNSVLKQVLNKMGITRSIVKRIGNKTLRVLPINIVDIEEMIGGKLEPLQDIDWEKESESGEY